MDHLCYHDDDEHSGCLKEMKSWEINTQIIELAPLAKPCALGQNAIPQARTAHLFHALGHQTRADIYSSSTTCKDEKSSAHPPRSSLLSSMCMVLKLHERWGSRGRRRKRGIKRCLEQHIVWVSDFTWSTQRGRTV